MPIKEETLEFKTDKSAKYMAYKNTKMILKEAQVKYLMIKLKLVQGGNMNLTLRGRPFPFKDRTSNE